MKSKPTTREHTNQARRLPKGFTIIELLIATVVFSVVLIVILAAFIQISRLFYKGVNMTKSQEDARNIIQDIANDITFAQTPPDFNPITGNNRPANSYFCVGLHLYKYQLGHQLGTSGGAGDYGIIRQTVSFASGCNKSSSGTDPEELLDNGMQLNNLNISCSGGRCLINVHLVFYGGTPQGLFTTSDSAFTSSPWLAPDAQCTGSLTDSQYCSVADYSSAVLQRP